MEEAVDDSESLTSLSNPNPDEQVDESRGDEAMEEGGRGRSGEDAEKEKESAEAGTEVDERVEQEENSGGSLIDHIISRLPVSVPEDVAPEADEASLLISIARD